MCLKKSLHRIALVLPNPRAVIKCQCHSGSSHVPTEGNCNSPKRVIPPSTPILSINTSKNPEPPPKPLLVIKCTLTKTNAHQDIRVCRKTVQKPRMLALTKHDTLDTLSHFTQQLKTQQLATVFEPGCLLTHPNPSRIGLGTSVLGPFKPVGPHSAPPSCTHLQLGPTPNNGFHCQQRFDTLIGQPYTETQISGMYVAPAERIVRGVKGAAWVMEAPSQGGGDLHGNPPFRATLCSIIPVEHPGLAPCDPGALANLGHSQWFDKFWCPM